MKKFMQKFMHNFTDKFMEKFMRKFMRKFMKKFMKQFMQQFMREGEGGLLASTASKSGFCMENLYIFDKNVISFFCFWDCFPTDISRSFL